MILLLLYLVQLKPDIITSCCGVVFGGATGDGTNLIGPMPVQLIMALFYGLAGLLFGVGIIRLNRLGRGIMPASKPAGILFSLLWIIFFSLSFLVITAVISSYIYEMPFHRCPFDILKKEYGYVGYLVYVPLFAAAFFGMSTGLTSLFSTHAWSAGIRRGFAKKFSSNLPCPFASLSLCGQLVSGSLLF